MVGFGPLGRAEMFELEYCFGFQVSGVRFQRLKATFGIEDNDFQIVINSEKAHRTWMIF